MLLLHITFDAVINVTYCMKHLVVDYYQRHAHTSFQPLYHECHS